MKRILLLPLLLLIAATPAPPPLNARIVAFCEKNIGKQVGNGQCTALAEGAIAANGGRHHDSFRPGPARDDYVWGALSGLIGPDNLKIDKVLPGDIIQMRSVRFEIGGGGWYEAEHHTAVVKSIRDGDLIVYEQNMPGRIGVIETTLHLADMTRGWMRVYRPIRK